MLIQLSQANRWVLRWRQKPECDWMVPMWTGNEFQAAGPATCNPLLPLRSRFARLTLGSGSTVFLFKPSCFPLARFSSPISSRSAHMLCSTSFDAFTVMPWMDHNSTEWQIVTSVAGGSSVCNVLPIPLRFVLEAPLFECRCGGLRLFVFTHRL